jgi:copper(I)-binding protein
MQKNLSKTFIRVVMALIAILYLATHFIPRAHAHDGIDHSGAAAQHEALVLGDLEVSAAFARATLPNAPVGGAYMTIVNTGETDDQLVSVASDVAEAVALHDMALVDDVMTMQPVEGGLALPAGETVTLAPGGLHVMFMGLGQPFVEGECVTMTLVFQTAGTTDICVPIVAAAADGPMEHAGHEAGHSH